MTKGTGVKSRFTPEQDQAIKDGYEQGLLAAEIAEQIGKNKNAVIGRAWRLGLRSALQGSAGSKRWYGLEKNQKQRESHVQQFSHFAEVKEWGERNPFGSIRNCAKQLGLSETTVKKHAKAIRESALQVNRSEVKE